MIKKSELKKEIILAVIAGAISWGVAELLTRYKKSKEKTSL